MKLLGSESPDLRLEAVGAGGASAMMGDALPGGEAQFEARVLGGAPNVDRELLVFRDGTVIDTVPVTGDDFKHSFSASQPGEYRIQVQRGSTVDALSNPIGLDVERRAKPAGAPGARPRILLTVKPRRARGRQAHALHVQGAQLAAGRCAVRASASPASAGARTAAGAP